MIHTLIQTKHSLPQDPTNTPTKRDGGGDGRGGRGGEGRGGGGGGGGGGAKVSLNAALGMQG